MNFRGYSDILYVFPRITYFEAIFLGCFSPFTNHHRSHIGGTEMHGFEVTRWSPRIHGSSKGRPGEGGVLRVFQVGASAVLTSLS